MSVYIPASVLNDIEDAFAVVDGDHRIAYLNKSFEKIFSTERSRCTGLKLENTLKFSSDFDWKKVYASQTISHFQTKFHSSIFDLDIKITAVPLPIVENRTSFLIYFYDLASIANKKVSDEYSSSQKMDEIAFISGLPEMANNSSSSDEFLNRSQVKMLRTFQFHAMATYIYTQNKELSLVGYQTDGQIHRSIAEKWQNTFHRHIEESIQSDMPKKFQEGDFHYLVVPHKKRSSLFAASLVALPHESAEYQIRILQIFGHQLAVCFENTKLVADSTIDGLTQIYNSKFFRNRLTSEMIIAQTTDSDMSLLLLDVDHFKKFNDTYGHLMGDKVLTEVAKVIKNTCRPSDVVCRYGGEEFAIILIDTSEKGALIVAEKVRSAIEAQTIDPQQPEIKVTVSIGVATFPTSANNQEEIMRNADQALYKAKRSGRNRTEHFDLSKTSQ